MPEQPVSGAEAKRVILLILEQGTFEMTSHARERMRKRNASYQDIVNTLETGQILREPEWDEGHGHWKYRVEGVDLDGDSLTAITVIFDSEMSLLVVTLFD